LRVLPKPLPKEYEALAEALNVPFTGDASFFAYNGEEAEEPDPDNPDAPPAERFRELHRLSYTVKVFLYEIEKLVFIYIHLYL